MIGDYRLDPPDFETVEEILEGCFTLEQAREFVSCRNFIEWYDYDACDEDLTENAETWYNACVENNCYILDEVKSNCQEYDLADTDIIEHLIHVGK